jgi:hypothetical protein
LKDLQEGKSDNYIKKRVVEEYQTDTETIEKDLYDFFKMIEQFNLTDNHE